MSDLIERLRHADVHSQQRVFGSRIFGEAADLITSLERDAARYQEARRVAIDECLVIIADYAGKHSAIAAAIRRIKPSSEAEGREG